MDDLKHTVFLWRKSRLTMIGSAIILAFLLLAALAPLIAPFDPVQQNLQNKLQPPSWQHLFGTDQFGRDIYSRVVTGSRIALWIIFLVSVISGSIGIIVGVTAGYFGGIVDEVLMRITDMFLAFPSLVLAMAFAAMLGPNLTNTIIAISIVTWTTYARLSRAEATKVKSQPYIEAIRAAGGGNLRIMFLHVLPMCISPVLVQLTLRMGTIILTAASLGFLGLGVQPPTPEWGAMVSDGRNYLVDQWWISTFPGIFIALVVLGFNLLGDGIRDMLDPRLRR
ncbi:MAG: ABC-type dipeptide/oligopeptide/nickel transport system, permease component [Mesotoga prima]|uniref:ABC-type dipeptide/oligopeptide/nickel transport system, permease component n=1 Tax=Mesotoga prima TaxID=1184387 RepID=A0A101HL18_9BACT|nr:MAG: ABC-type dipeptide/oligopeptide/nickel transport system, permease component [Mesotoga prima]